MHVTFLPYTTPNIVILLGTRDGKGIEALVFLSPEDMAFFERNQELLSFATLNPPIQENNKEEVSFFLKSSL